ncbi:unnamed protein product [Rotaria magnacalcarata]
MNINGSNDTNFYHDMYGLLKRKFSSLVLVFFFISPSCLKTICAFSLYFEKLLDRFFIISNEHKYSHDQL